VHRHQTATAVYADSGTFRSHYTGGHIRSRSQRGRRGGGKPGLQLLDIDTLEINGPVDPNGSALLPSH